MIRGDEGLEKITKGEVAPFGGWILTDATFLMLYEQALRDVDSSE